ncbi:MAG: DUF4350 domain-containing protein [Vitreoscilla sp.]
MKSAALVRTLVGVLVLALSGWVIHHTRWEEVEVDDAARGAAASDDDYALRKILSSVGATLEVRTSLEPMPPPGATLVLESEFWNIFPERDARLRGWVENGGQLVLGKGVNLLHGGHDLAWVPMSTAATHRSAAGAPPPEDQASSERAEEGRDAGRRLPGPFGSNPPPSTCWNYAEPEATTTPAFERGRIFRGCAGPYVVHALRHVSPTWTLSMRSRGPFTPDSRMLAMRVPVGRGSVTTMTPFIASYNRGLLEGDNALIVAAVLQARSGQAIWIVRDEAREPLLAWLWHEARTPSLLTLAAIALALWRLMMRFGPREAVPPQARRSMGEQVRGTGHFIAGSDPRALHAATRQAFEAVARRRIERWAELDDADRIAELGPLLQPPHAPDRATLQASMNIGAGATPPQILAAIAVLEQARRALLRAAATPPVN